MKNRTFCVCAALCLTVVLLANIDLLLVPASLRFGTVWFIALGNLSKAALYGLIPAFAGGMIVVMAMGRLRLWESCCLCLSLGVFYTLIHNIGSELYSLIESNGEESFSLMFYPFLFYFQTAAISYLFPTTITMLAFYGFTAKKHLIAGLCTTWSSVYGIFFHVVPPFFQKFKDTSLDNGSATRLLIYNGLTIAAIALLVLFIILDLYSARRDKANENGLSGEA